MVVLLLVLQGVTYSGDESEDDGDNEGEHGFDAPLVTTRTSM